MPDHRRHGLATALPYEGMRRLKVHGAAQASVVGGGISNPKAEVALEPSRQIHDRIAGDAWNDRPAA